MLCGTLGPSSTHALPVGTVSDTPTMLVLAAVEDRDGANLDFPPDAVRLSALVSRIQDVLAELGLYTGPSDGRVSPATDRAIRIYESQVNLAVTGRPTRELLDHLETVGRANKLLVRLRSWPPMPLRKRARATTSASAKSLESCSRLLAASRSRPPRSPCWLTSHQNSMLQTRPTPQTTSSRSPSTRPTTQPSAAQSVIAPLGRSLPSMQR